MKLLIFVFALAVVAASERNLYSDDEITRMKQYSKECEESTHVTHDKITSMRDGHFDDHDEHLKEYVSCFMKKLDWQHDDGTIDKDHIKKDLARSSTLSDAMGHCIDKHGSNAADTAYIIFKCYRKHLPADVKASL